jgi:hypothetical protein
MRELLSPLFVQVALTFVLLFATAGARTSALRRGKVKMGDIALGQRAWPTKVTQIGNAFQNQLELPMLFYLAIAIALITKASGAPMVHLAWAVVVTRLVHAFIHTTGNNVVRRFYAFLAGVIILLAMWILLASRILLS